MRFTAILLVVLSSALLACGSPIPADTPNQVGDTPNIIAAKAYDLVIDSPVENNSNGDPSTPIAATIFVPEHVEGSNYPLILHSHGWGGDRVTEEDTQNEFDSSNFYSVAVDAEVQEFWKDGYAVVSFDERGFHDSGGAIRVMDPAYETRDAIAVLDWADDNLDLRRNASGDPLVGAIGGSYGGGFQLLLAAFDTRLDAIAPSATWNNLPDSLAPNGVIKKLWDFGLCVSATSAGDRTFSDELNQACQEAGFDPSTRFADEMDPAILEFLAAHGMGAMQRRHEDSEDDFQMRPIDTLLTQGQRDLLFPLNDAVANQRFLSSLGGDVRVISNQHGHYIGPPLDSQAPLGAMKCGGLDTREAMHLWFAEKLKGVANAADQIPTVCIGLDDDNGANLEQIPVADGSTTVAIPETTIRFEQNNYGGSDPTFIAFGTAIPDDGTALAGIPVADITISAVVPGTDVVGFVGIGVRSVGDDSVRVIDDQIAALRAGQHTSKELVGVGEMLYAGDQLGVVLFGDVEAFNNSGHTAWSSNNYTISGSVALPVLPLPEATN